MPLLTPEQIRTGTPVTPAGQPWRHRLTRVDELLLAVFLIEVFATIGGAFLPAVRAVAGFLWWVFGLTALVVWVVEAIVARRRRGR